MIRQRVLTLASMVRVTPARDAAVASAMTPTEPAGFRAGTVGNFLKHELHTAGAHCDVVPVTQHSLSVVCSGT
jgi:hypothetical protein